MLEHVHEQEIVELLQALIQAPSVNPPADTRACANVLLDVFRAEGIDAQSVEGRIRAVNVVATMTGSKPGPRLILNGHVDTVPAGEGWSVDPFSGELRDGCIWGRGSCDMKSGVAAMLMAMVELKRSAQPLNGEIIFQAVADEETGSQFGTLHLIEVGYAPTPAWAICAEPTSLRVELGNRGLRWIDIVVHGQASHSGRPGLGANAVSAAAEVIRRIEALDFTVHDERFEIPDPTVAVTMIAGGHTVNVIPDRCVFSVDRRMLPGETEEQVLAEMESAIAPVRDSRPGIEVDVELHVRPGNWDPYVISPDEPVARAAVEAARTVLGREPEIGYKAASTDASHLVTRAGIPTVLFGPGNEQLSHRPDERIAVADLVKAVEVYVEMFRRLLGAGGKGNRE